MSFPPTQIENLSVSRMIVGSNWFFGWSHTSKAKDQYIKATMDTRKIADVLEVFLAAGDHNQAERRRDRGPARGIRDVRRMNVYSRKSA